MQLKNNNLQLILPYNNNAQLNRLFALLYAILAETHIHVACKQPAIQEICGADDWAAVGICRLYKRKRSLAHG